jgi:Flp pilus assembly protein TadG
MRNKRATGQALVEFALLLPILAILFVVMTDLSLTILDRQILQAAATEAAIYGSIVSDPRIALDIVEREAIARTAGVILAKNAVATVSATGFKQGDLLTVNISADQHFLFFTTGKIGAAFCCRYQ